MMADDPKIDVIPRSVREIIAVYALDYRFVSGGSNESILRLYELGGLSLVRLIHMNCPIRDGHSLLFEACDRTDIGCVRWVLSTLPLPHLDDLICQLWYAACLDGKPELAGIFEENDNICDCVMTRNMISHIARFGSWETVEKARLWIIDEQDDEDWLDAIWRGAWRSGKYHTTLAANKALLARGRPLPGVDIGFVNFGDDPRLVHMFHNLWPATDSLSAEWAMIAMCERGELRAAALIKTLWGVSVATSRLEQWLRRLLQYASNVRSLKWFGEVADLKKMCDLPEWPACARDLWNITYTCGDILRARWLCEYFMINPTLMILLPPDTPGQAAIFDAIVEQYPGCTRTSTMLGEFRRHCHKEASEMLPWYYSHLVERSAEKDALSIMGVRVYASGSLPALLSEAEVFMLSKVWNSDRWDKNTSYLREGDPEVVVDLVRLFAAHGPIILEKRTESKFQKTDDVTEMTHVTVIGPQKQRHAIEICQDKLDLRPFCASFLLGGDPFKTLQDNWLCMNTNSYLRHKLIQLVKDSITASR
jgi:hypothetical protein